MKPEALIRVRFINSSEGGRKTPIKGDKYGCPIMINDKDGFDCRFVLNSVTSFQLGESYDIPVKFLNPDIALRYISEGTEISLWEGKIIAVGTVIKILT